MDPRIEQILLAQAASEAEEGPRLSDSVAASAALGAGLGVLGGQVPHSIGNFVNSGKDALARRQGITPKKSFGRAIKPGARMAGGLVGAILGGAMGAGAQQAALEETGRSGQLLAELQAQQAAGQDMTPDQQFELMQVLKEAYARNGILG